MTGIMDRAIEETPIAVIDFETTGLSPGADRVIEVSVVRIDPGQQQPELIFDSLVNPRRRVAATEVHGITDEDVADAPTFAQIAGDFFRALSGAVVASYNIYFDIGFLRQEFRDAGIDEEPPHLCLMYLRPMLGLGTRCCLLDACQAHKVSHTPTHTAASDSAAAAQLMLRYLPVIRDHGVTTFGELGQLKQYKFVSSFAHPPLAETSVAHIGSCTDLKSRAGTRINTRPASPTRPPRAEDRPSNSLADYWEALTLVLSDLKISRKELNDLRDIRAKTGVKQEQIRVLHARALIATISRYAGDGRLDDNECHTIHRLWNCLSELGWAPGELPEGRKRVSEKPVTAVEPEGTNGHVEEHPSFAGKSFVVTGTLLKYKRAELQAIIKRLGGRASGSISSKTDYLVAGDKAGSKLEKALKLGVKVLSEKDFDELLDGDG